MKSMHLIGCICVFCSAICFYLATVIIRWSESYTSIDPACFVFGRFLFGFFVVCGVLAVQKRSPTPRRFGLLLGRTVANCIAVYCFYKAVDVTTVAEANILNMTYPVFVVVLSWIWLKDQRDMIEAFMVVVAFIGVWLILSPKLNGFTIGWNNVWGICSGLSAAFAILYLNLSRHFHDTQTILFYMFGIGTIMIFGLFPGKVGIVDAQALYWVSLCSLCGIGGQFLLTLGFRYVTAVEGGVISSSRILLSAVLGPVMVAESALPMAGWIGAGLLFAANSFLATRKPKTPATTA